MSEECRRHRVEAPIVAPSVCASCALEKVRGEHYEFAVENERLRTELAALKAGKGEAVAIAECREVHGHMCQFLNRTQHGMDTLRDGDKLYTAPPASADARLVPVELMRRLTKRVMLRSQEGAHADACEELRALLARQGVKS